MDNTARLEDNKAWNAHFLRAFKHLQKELNLNQAQVANLLGTNSSNICDYKSGKKRASKDIMQRLGAQYGGRLYMKYLTNESEYMLLENVPKEEIQRNLARESNPDYDLMKKERHEIEKKPATASAASLIELAATLIKEVEGMRQQLTVEREAIAKERDDLRALMSEIQATLNKLQTDRMKAQYIPTPPTYLATAEPK